DRRQPDESPEDLLRRLRSVEDTANRAGPGEDLFLFLYQQARVLRRIDPEKALDSYENAVRVAEAGGLHNRSGIARIAAARIKRRSGRLGIPEFLEEALACCAVLEQYPEDSWAFNSLFKTLVDDIVDSYLEMSDRDQAWAAMNRAFDVELDRA